MNAVRFDYKDYGDGESSIYDNVKDEYYFDCNLDKIADELNELNNENKKLLQELEYYKQQAISENVKWLRENTVWEQSPTHLRPITKTSLKKR